MASLARASSRPSASTFHNTLRNDAPDPLLYTLNFDCPFAWPTSPSYLAKDASKPSLNGHTGSNNAGTSIDGVKTIPGPSSGSANTAFGHEADAVVEGNSEGRSHFEGMDVAEANYAVFEADGTASAHSPAWPASLRELYLECLYRPIGDTVRPLARVYGTTLLT